MPEIRRPSSVSVGAQLASTGGGVDASRTEEEGKKRGKKLLSVGLSVSLLASPLARLRVAALGSRLLHLGGPSLFAKVPAIPVSRPGADA